MPRVGIGRGDADTCGEFSGEQPTDERAEDERPAAEKECYQCHAAHPPCWA